MVGKFASGGQRTTRVKLELQWFEYYKGFKGTSKVSCIMHIYLHSFGAFIHLYLNGRTNFPVYIQCCIIEACRDGVLWHNKVTQFVLYIKIHFQSFRYNHTTCMIQAFFGLV